MATIDLSLIGKVEEIVSTLTFRDEAAVKIRKIKREKAFSQAVDIIIRSISYNLYENFKATPPIQFYGYATLVMQDCTEIAIPITSSRQRLYYGFQYEAFRQWRHWIEFYQLYQLHRFNDISLASIMGALEIPYEEKKPRLKENGWIELPIREVYIRLQSGTQFEIEFTQWQPIKFTDPISGEEIDGKSNHEDGDKDDGLPKDGIQPKNNLGNENPFSGNPSTSSLEEAGFKGFDLVDSSNLSQVDPNNGIEPPVYPDDWGYFAEITATFKIDLYGCEFRTRKYYYLINSEDTLSTSKSGEDIDICYQRHSQSRVVGSISGTIDTGFLHVGGLSTAIVRSPSKPVDTFV